MKLKPLEIFYVLGTLIPTIVGLITIVQWLRPDIPKVYIYYSIEKVNLPKDHLEALNKLSNPYHESDFQRFKKSLEILRKNDSLDLTLFDDKFLDAMGAVIKPHVLSLSYSKVVLLHVTNTGKKPAKDLNIIFPDSGYAEISEKGSVTRETESSGHINISTVYPDVDVDIKYWTDVLGLNPVTASYVDGSAIVVKDDVRRSSGKIIFELDWIEIILFGPLLCLSILMLVIRLIELRRIRTRSK